MSEKMIPKKDYKKIVVLTGAGISAESGITTFRDSNGLWEQYRMEEVATPEAYIRDPQRVWKFYSMRRLQAAGAGPNKAHEALVELAEVKKGHVHLITQNVDVLHQRADQKEVLPPLCMHGSLNESRCTNCGTVYFDDHAYFDLKGNYAPQETVLCNQGQRASTQYLHHYKLNYKDFLPLSPCCNTPIRPNIVWFGEIPFHMPKIDNLLKDADLFVSIGTSGQVYPAAGFLQMAKSAGAYTVCINKEEIPQSRYIDLFIEGPATVKVPEFFRSLT
ncbi:MAG: SIR2 family NAD-dependent protein deacylase [Bacteriovoracia bacterium]